MKAKKQVNEAYRKKSTSEQFFLVRRSKNAHNSDIRNSMRNKINLVFQFFPKLQSVEH